MMKSISTITSLTREVLSPSAPPCDVKAALYGTIMAM